nr:hypothetical protein GCM10020093_005660 [Planobispora longispora]
MNAIRETWLVFRHNTRIALRQKAGIVFGVLQPLLYLVLFGPLFATIGTWETLLPACSPRSPCSARDWPDSASSSTRAPVCWSGSGSPRRAVRPCCSAGS